ncbi:hypothetical protein PsorP6_001543 [Peronosclerospora sorghi]|uniref:Uncharacterized protein n=1 Tax=Peronosclerospora sorghi TaxID=230839 RepID=A0ACC0WRZ4_9STRA|nr:hypothetical protein PsorP6_001543 [Peronosclerospora sorghi]
MPWRLSMLSSLPSRFRARKSIDGSPRFNMNNPKLKSDKKQLVRQQQDAQVQNSSWKLWQRRRRDFIYQVSGIFNAYEGDECRHCNDVRAIGETLLNRMNSGNSSHRWRTKGRKRFPLETLSSDNKNLCIAFSQRKVDLTG